MDGCGRNAWGLCARAWAARARGINIRQRHGGWHTICNLSNKLQHQKHTLGMTRRPVPLASLEVSTCRHTWGGSRRIPASSGDRSGGGVGRLCAPRPMRRTFSNRMLPPMALRAALAPSALYSGGAISVQLLGCTDRCGALAMMRASSQAIGQRRRGPTQP